MSKQYSDNKITTFISTSLSKKEVKKFTTSGCCIYIISLTPGDYGILPLHDVSDYPEEEEVLLPPGMLSIQKRDKDEDNIDIFYCTFIPDNAQFININIDLKDKIELSSDNWINRIFESGIKDEIELLCDNFDEFDACAIDMLKTLDFYEDIPEIAVKKFVTLISNIKEKIKI